MIEQDKIANMFRPQSRPSSGLKHNLPPTSPYITSSHSTQLGLQTSRYGGSITEFLQQCAINVIVTTCVKIQNL